MVGCKKTVTWSKLKRLKYFVETYAFGWQIFEYNKPKTTQFEMKLFKTDRQWNEMLEERLNNELLEKQSFKNLCRMKECNYCYEKNVKLKTCNRCHEVYYCSKKCQKLDWKIGNHGKNCEKRVK